MRNFSLSLLIIYFFSSCGCTQSTMHWDDKVPVHALNKLCQLNKTVVETSGLIAYKERIYTINDSGDASNIYEIDANNGKVLNKIEVLKARNRDWEALTRDDHYLYIADIGNNKGDRSRLTIYKVSLEKLDKADDEVKHDGIITFSYPKGKPRYNAEAMVALDEELLIFTKNSREQNTQMFTLSKNTGHHEAKLCGNFESKGLVTAATLIDKRLILLGYANRERYQSFIWVFNKFKVKKPFSTKPKKYRLPDRLQFEAITYDQDKRYILSNEGRGKNPPMLWELLLN